MEALTQLLKGLFRFILIAALIVLAFYVLFLILIAIGVANHW
jgi:uncharacterized membrane protein (DUF485 family)